MNLYRGFKSIPEIGAIKKVRKDRKPRDLDINTHNKVDEYFYEKFGIKFRSQSLFCTGSINNAKNMVM